MKKYKIITILLSFYFLFPNFLIASDTLDPPQKNSISAEDVLDMSLEDMMNVKISTAGKKTEKLAEIPASAVLITRSDIEKYGYLTLEEILDNVPGMYPIDALGAYRKTYGVRGFYSGYPRTIVFLVNGIPQTDGMFDYNVMSNFVIPVESIDRIEVVRGPMAVMYGQGAFFGAINIITNDSYDETSLASFSYGNMTHRATAKVADTKENFKYSISAGYSYTEGPELDWNKMASDISSLAGNGIGPNNDTTEDRLERDSLNFIFSGKYEHFYTDLQINHSTDDINVYTPSIGDGSAYHRDSAKFSIGFENQINKDIRLDTRLTFHHFAFTLDWDIAIASSSGDAGETEGGGDMLEFELDTFIDVSEDLDLTTGLYYKSYFNPEFGGALYLFNLAYTDTTDDNIHLYAAFAQADYHPWDKLKLVAGLRLEQMSEYTITRKQTLPSTSSTNRRYGDDDLELLPNIAAIYSFDERNIIKLMYGRAINRPSFFQNRDQILHSYPNLETEEIQTFEINYSSNPSPNFTFNASLFHNILDDLIVRSYTLSGSNLVVYNANDGDFVTNGIEISAQTRFLDKFMADLSLTYQKTEDQRTEFEHLDVAYSPHFLGYAKLSYEFTDDVILAMTANYVDGMETEWDQTLNNDAGGRVGDATDSYYLFGLNLRVNNLFGTTAYLNARCSNILDEEYYYPTYTTNTYADNGTLGNPREFLLSIGYKF